MYTKILEPNEQNIEYATYILTKGGVVGIPTETVYGLGANALDDSAVEKIFIAKGRPQDNPLIVHVSSMEMLEDCVVEVSDIAKKLADEFWPGELTMIFQKSELVPVAVTGGLSTIAVRMPRHKVTCDLIEKCGFPIAAPSANVSGLPSPTTAEHVYNDMCGRIPVIIDGGECEFGLESTVVLLRDDDVVILRPGAVTKEMIEKIGIGVEVAEGVGQNVDETQPVLSPGMKYKHYSPKADLALIDSDLEKFCDYVNARKEENIGAMVFDGETSKVQVPSITYGDKDNPLIQAKMLFVALRALDDIDVKRIYCRVPSVDGVGLAIYDRLLRASGFEVIKL